jgi:hypothetical protein
MQRGCRVIDGRAVADRACQFCGTPLAPKTWFCTNCGAPAIAAGSGATAAPSFPVLPGYTVLAEIAREGGTEEYRARVRRSSTATSP